MNSGIWNPFEHPYTLLLAAIAVQFAMMIIHIVRPQSRKWRHILPAAVIVIAAFALDYFVVTDMEKIQELMRNGVQAAQDENLSGLDAMIATDYSDPFNKRKADVMAMFGKWLSQPLIEKNNVSNLKIEINGTDATVALSVFIHLDKSSEYYREIPTVYLKTRLGLRKYGSEWLVHSMEMVEVNNQKVDWGSF